MEQSLLTKHRKEITQ